jgi:DNA repair exonuclease SbcCD ATPase subunit
LEHTVNITELNNAQIEVREAIAERDRLARALESAERSLAEQRRQEQEMSDSLRKENEDVRRLENTSLVGLFFAIMGSKEARLDKERQELLAAKLKYNNVQRRVAGLEQDVSDLRERLGRLGSAEGLQRRYDSLLVEKERLLAAQDGPATRRLVEMGAELAGIRAEQKELNEAVQAGKKARAGLDQVVEALESASNWGTWDLLGGGLLASVAKHDKLDEAHEAVQEVQPLLQRFERELADVGGPAALHVETGGLAAFADIFIDGLLVDLLVQSRINDSLDAARAMQRKVGSLLDRLSQRCAETDRRAHDLESERRSLLEVG